MSHDKSFYRNEKGVPIEKPAPGITNFENMLEGS